MRKGHVIDDRDDDVDEQILGEEEEVDEERGGGKVFGGEKELRSWEGLKNIQ